MNIILTFLVLALALGVSTASAVPVPFDVAQFDLLGTADVTDAAGGAIDSDGFSVSAPPAPLPAQGDANAASPGGSSAFAFASAGDGFLSVGTEALPVAGETADATSSSTFSGTFTSPGGPLTLRLDFDFSQVLTGGIGTVELVFGVAGFLAPESVLFDTGGGNTLTLLRSFSPASGAAAVLDLLLTASGSGGAQNLGNLAFRIDTVPEPGTLALLLPGLVAVFRKRGAAA